MNYILNDPLSFLMSHIEFNLTVCTHGLGGGLGAPKCFQCSNICHGTYTERGIWVMYRTKCIWNVCREKNHENTILGRVWIGECWAVGVGQANKDQDKDKHKDKDKQTDKDIQKDKDRDKHKQMVSSASGSSWWPTTSLNQALQVAVCQRFATINIFF